MLLNWVIRILLTVQLFINNSKSISQLEFIANDNIRLGVDKSRGGSIAYLSNASNNVNIINTHDMGREVQLLFHSGPNPFKQNCGAWPWSAAGAGDSYGNPSKIISFRRPTPTSFHIKTQPLQWECNNIASESIFEQYIELNGQRVDVNAIIYNNRSDHTDYGNYSQSLPAAYTIGKLYQLWTYNGSNPWNKGPLTRFSKLSYAPTPWGTSPWHPGSFAATESWAALVNDGLWGLGVVNFNTTIFVGGFHGIQNEGYTNDDNCGYISPHRLIDLTWNIKYEYNFSLVLGNLYDIRNIAYRLHEKNNGYHAHKIQKKREVCISYGLWIFILIIVSITGFISIFFAIWCCWNRYNRHPYNRVM